MTLFLLSLCSLIAFIYCQQQSSVDSNASAAYPQPFEPMRSVSVPLNAPPQLRFQSVVDTILTNGGKQAYEQLFAHYNKTLLQLLPSNTLDICDAAIRKFFPIRAKEINGIAERFQFHNFSVTGILFL
jgi:hypothetical protein